jgi:hypothetical protein
VSFFISYRTPGKNGAQTPTILAQRQKIRRPPQSSQAADSR